MNSDAGFKAIVGGSRQGRRSFMRSGLSFGMAGMAGLTGAANSEPIGARMPDAMKTLGSADLRVGRDSGNFLQKIT